MISSVTWVCLMEHFVFGENVGEEGLGKDKVSLSCEGTLESK